MPKLPRGRGGGTLPQIYMEEEGRWGRWAINANSAALSMAAQSTLDTE